MELDLNAFVQNINEDYLMTLREQIIDAYYRTAYSGKAKILIVNPYTRSQLISEVKEGELFDIEPKEISPKEKFLGMEMLVRVADTRKVISFELV